MKKFISGIFWAWLFVFLPLYVVAGSTANANVYEGKAKNIDGAVKPSGGTNIAYSVDSGTILLFSGELESSLYTTKLSCAIASDNPEELKKYCRGLKEEFPKKKEIISAKYIKDGMTLLIKIEDCDHVPQKSICIDDKHCALCYFDEDK